MGDTNSGLGGVILTSDYNELIRWVQNSVKSYPPDSHGEGYKQSFFCRKISNQLSVCFYVIEGYSTPSENRAFEHQFFVMDGFLNILESRRPKESKPPKNYLAFADVGSDIEDDEFIGFKALEEGLSFYNTSLDKLLEYRNSIAEHDTLIWSSYP
ncbi:hypothetical protein [Vallitalea maricola]|uniref:Uncharacterized protein n=1 Tax=Vallitalea maricola TaxID=3074433 RepID=A0ACB5ULJ8_9FIRM|nr:hypothetical protein AN2V17_30720 [Vallitalea sp. AN17-2]